MIGGVWTSAALGTWGKPPDQVAWVALGTAVLLALVSVAPRAVHEVLGVGTAMEPDQRRRFIAGSAFVAAFLSLGYVAFYLHDGPRIIDATSYYLEAHGIARGKLSWAVPSPTASFRGRFLLFRDPSNLSVIFPPGYPMLLAAGFVVGAPLVIGPLIAAGLVVATYLLARELCEPGDPNAEAIAVIAALFSLVSAALRYHTADTMAHGASALGITLALACALRGRRLRSVRHFVLAGLAIGGVMATRPVSSLPIAIAVFVLCATSAIGPRALTATLAAIVPGVVLLCVAQHAQTGSWFASSQEVYYATSDGPPGCFRYGFGKDTGCLYEHGDFVKAHLASGYGFVAALGTTARRLKAHLIDPLNFEPLILLVLWPLWGRMRTKGGLALAVVLGQVVAYAPFYFDGNYQGGGARLFADVLPIEHALAALAVSLILPGIQIARRGLFALALASFGFAVHGAFDHVALANRDGGRPMYEPDVARDAQVTRGLLFIDTDHGYNLAETPGGDPDRDIVAARSYGDDHDRLLYEHYNHPPAHAYHFNGEGPQVTVWVPPGGSPDFWRFEAEADWPPLLQSGGWAEPVWMNGTCASQEKALALHVAAGAAASMTIELPIPKDGRWLVTPRVIRTGGPGRATLRLEPRGRLPYPDDEKLVWSWVDEEASGTKVPRETCQDLVPRETPLVGNGLGAGARWVLTATGGTVTLDRTTIKLLH